MNRKQLAKYLDGSRDPMMTVPHLPDGVLGQLTDALYGHLDTPHPAFEAHTWYDLAIEEACKRRLHMPHGTPGLSASGEPGTATGEVAAAGPMP